MPFVVSVKASPYHIFDGAVQIEKVIAIVVYRLRLHGDSRSSRLLSGDLAFLGGGQTSEQLLFNNTQNPIRKNVSNFDMVD